MKRKPVPEKITIGDDVAGIGGMLGEVSRAIVEDGAITALVVKHGLFEPREFVVPLSVFDVDTDGKLGLPLTVDQLETFEPFDMSQYHLPEAGYQAPLPLDATAAYSGTGFVALGPRMFTASGQPVETRPYEPPQALRQAPWSAISTGSEVVDRRGDRVGKVAELALDVERGGPAKVIVKSGFLGHARRDLPLPWVEGLEEDRIVLRVAREEVEALPTV